MVQEHIANQRAIIGARTSSLERHLDLISERKIAIEKDISDISDADLAELVTQLQSQITGLQASQQAFVKISVCFFKIFFLHQNTSQVSIGTTKG